jgi:tripartite ATP-independent transporter DctP family solute receptor
MNEYRPIRRRTALSGAAAGIAVSALPHRARAAEFEYKMGHSSPESDPFHKRLLEVSARIAKESGGRMTLTVFPNSQLGGDNDLLSQCRSGAIEFCQPAGLILASVLPVTAIDGMGFAFKDYAQIWPAMDGDLGQYVRSQISARAGLVPMERIWDLGFRQIANVVKPISTVGDLAGMKIRVPGAPAMVSLFQALGAYPVSMQFAEVYTSLQTHVVDGVEPPLSNIEFAKFYEIAKYCSLTNHIWNGYWICANPAAWNELPPDLRDLVAHIFNEVALLERADVAERDRTLRGYLESKGMVFNAVDQDSFRAKLRAAGFYTEWKGKIGDQAWSLLEKYVGKMG